MSDKKHDREVAAYRLQQQDPFVGGLLQQITLQLRPAERAEELKAPASLQWDSRTGKFKILLTEEWYGSFSHDERTALLKHELMHFSLGHIFDSIRFSDTQQQARLRNVATDMAINQYIDHLPKGGIDVAEWKDKEGKPFPVKRSSHEYMSLLTELLQDEGKSNVKKQLDKYGPPHEWDEGEEPSPDDKEKMLDEGMSIIKRTMEKEHFSYDKLDQSIKDLLQYLETAKQQLDYRQILKNAVKRTLMSSDRSHTWKKPSKRYGIYSPGSKPEDMPKLAFFNDSSGSISIEEQNTYLRVMDGFLNIGSKHCLLAFWHTQLYYKKPYKRGKQIDQKEIEAGGTDPSCVLRDIAKHKYDLAIILTDGYYDRYDIPVSSQVIWIISKGGQVDHPMKHVGLTIPLDKL